MSRHPPLLAMYWYRLLQIIMTEKKTPTPPFLDILFVYMGFQTVFPYFNILVNLPSQYFLFFYAPMSVTFWFWFILYHMSTFYSTFRCLKSSINRGDKQVFFIIFLITEGLFVIIRYCFCFVFFGGGVEMFWYFTLSHYMPVLQCEVVWCLPNHPG